MVPEILFVAFTAAWSAVIITTTTVAILRSGSTERRMSVLTFTAWLVSVALADRDRNWSNPQIGIISVDIIYFLALTITALSSSRLWPLVCSGFQLCNVAIDAAYLLHPGFWQAAYLVALQIPSSAVLATVVWGVYTSAFSRRHDDS